MSFAVAGVAMGVAATGISVYSSIKAGHAEAEAAEQNARIKEEQAKVAKAEAESKDANAKLAASLAAGKTHTKEVQVVIEKRVHEVATKIDSECRVDSLAVGILNDAAKNTGGSK